MDDVVGEDVELGPVAGGSAVLRGYLVRPDEPPRWPGVVVIHEAWGLDDNMRRQAERMARAGYLTLAPNLFSDGGPRCVAATMQAMIAGKGNAYADIEAARRWLAGHADGTGKVGVIGFCMGGGFALVTAARGFDAAAPNYGMMPRRADQALAGACPIVASYGHKDLMMRGVARSLDRKLTDLGVAHDVKEYASAGHSFLNETLGGPRLLRPLLRVARMGPDPVAAEDAWGRIEAFFAEHLA
jgi:carboxymethylenebutenolidase